MGTEIASWVVDASRAKACGVIAIAALASAGVAGCGAAPPAAVNTSAIQQAMSRLGETIPNTSQYIATMRKSPNCVQALPQDELELEISMMSQLTVQETTIAIKYVCPDHLAAWQSALGAEEVAAS